MDDYKKHRIEKYLTHILQGEGYVSLEKLKVQDIVYDLNLISVKADINDVLDVAYLNGWKVQYTQDIGFYLFKVYRFLFV